MNPTPNNQLIIYQIKPNLQQTQNNQERPQWKYNTPLGETLEVIMHNLFKKILIKINDSLTYGDTSFKTQWYNEKDLSKFYKNKGYTTNNYMRLKNIVQDLVEKGEVDIEHWLGNHLFKIYNDALPNHSNENGKGKNQ